MSKSAGARLEDARIRRSYIVLAALLGAGLALVAVAAGFGVGGPGLLAVDTAVVTLVGAALVVAAVQVGLLYLVPHSLVQERARTRADLLVMQERVGQDHTAQEGRIETLEEAVRSNRMQMQALVRREADVVVRRLDGAVQSARDDLTDVQERGRALARDLTRLRIEEKRIREELLRQAIEARDADHRIESKVRVLEEAVARESEEIETLYARVPDDAPSHPLSEVEGIAARDRKRLGALGIHNTAQLQRADALRIARELSTWPNQVHHWQAMAALMDVEGIGAHYAEALDAVGIRDVHELSEADAEEVARRLREVQEGSAAIRPVSPEHVRAWIREARRMEKHA